jgi:cytochrome c oxidase subunit 2
MVLLVLTSVFVGGAGFYLQKRDSAIELDLTTAGASGMALAAQKGCTVCHSVDGKAGVGPSWKSAYGTLRSMTDGTQRVADDAYFRQSMLDPASEVVMDFQNVMLPAELSEAEISQLLVLLRELGAPDPG